MALDTQIRLAREWIRGDPDPRTRAELQAVIDSRDASAIEERLVPIEFGTAGIRGVVGAGPGRINLAVVRRVTRGLAEHVLATRRAAAPIVVGFDARCDSRRFAEEATGVLLAAGLPVRYFATPIPTPLVAFAALELRASAAIIVTASHNSAEYNGYKVYDADSVQLGTPRDRDISRRCVASGPASAIPCVAGAFDSSHSGAQPIPDDMLERYIEEVSTLRAPGGPTGGVRVVYTPLHGVGWDILRATMTRFGHTEVLVVKDQAEPDGRFPTLRSPNPEDPGVLDKALRLAASSGADLVLANDPDADRLAVCVPDGRGCWRQLTGNQVGLLLADDLLERSKLASPLVVSTVVSSPMLDAIGSARGAQVVRTLTGFKWMWSAALALEPRAPRFVFAYEEALGYCPGRFVRDKDGISSAVLIADLAARCKADGGSLLERLYGLYERHGLWVSAAGSVALPLPAGRELIGRALRRLSSEPPRALCGMRVTGVVDFRQHATSRPPWQPATDLMKFSVEGGGRLWVRPSGTEPKLKVYVDLPVLQHSIREIADREGVAVEQARSLSHALLQHVGLNAVGERR